MVARQKIDLTLSAKVQNNWRATDPESASADSEFDHVRRRALERDDQTCLGCGFYAKHWQEVHHINDDHSDNRLANLATVCQFCHKVQHIGLAGARGEAVLIFAPEFTQAEINHIVRTVLVAERFAEKAQQGGPQAGHFFKQAAEPMASGARDGLAQLKARQEAARKAFFTDNLTDLANVLLDMSDEDYARRGEIFYGARLLPLGHHIIDEKDRMPEIVESWISEAGPYYNRRPTTWKTILRQ